MFVLRGQVGCTVPFKGWKHMLKDRRKDSFSQGKNLSSKASLMMRAALASPGPTPTTPDGVGRRVVSSCS